MPLDIDEVEEQMERKENLVEDTHDAARTARNPSYAIKEMGESDEYDGVGFTATEVYHHIDDKLQDAEEGNPRHSNAEKASNVTFRDATSGGGTQYISNSASESDTIMEVQEDDGKSYFVDEDVYEQNK